MITFLSSALTFSVILSSLFLKSKLSNLSPEAVQELVECLSSAEQQNRDFRLKSSDDRHLKKLVDEETAYLRGILSKKASEV
jgi:hypothetical protein